MKMYIYNYNQFEEEDYTIDDVSVNPSDFIIPIEISDYKPKWEKTDNEKVGQFALEQKTVPDAVNSLITSLNMKPCMNTGTIKPNVLIYLIIGKCTSIIISW